MCAASRFCSFMDDLLLEIARKKKKIDESGILENKTFFKREEIYNNKRNIATKLNLEEVVDSFEQAFKNNSKLKSQNGISGAEKKIIPMEEVMRRFRVLGEPIRLFGETDEEASHRLKLLEMAIPDEDRGLRNDFQIAMERIDDCEGKIKNKILIKRNDNKNQDDLITYEHLQEIAFKSKDNPDFCSEMIIKFIKFLSRRWLDELNDRSIDVKKSLPGKLETARYEQTMQYIKPLHKKLKTKSLGNDILEFLTEIVQSCLQHEYVKANDSYLKMSIGNAPWPIGVTMVCIHARTGRERIFSQHVAHVLNDETQRKYIQAMKRLMTLCQKKYPADPSKCVEYKAL